jgi:hypothetical protein
LVAEINALRAVWSYKCYWYLYWGVDLKYRAHRCDKGGTVKIGKVQEVNAIRKGTVIKITQGCGVLPLRIKAV